MDYFRQSQEVRQQMTPEILDVARQGFAEEIEPFSFGGTVDLFYCGQLESGLYVALRKFRTDVQEGNNRLTVQKRMMENYCQNAERLYAAGNSVPAFCIGITNGSVAGILTEDISQGETVTVDHQECKPYAFVGEDRKKIYLDIDGVYHFIGDLEAKFFLDENLIRI